MLEAQKKLSPSSKVGTDLIILTGKNYVLVLDNYSHFPEIASLQDTTAKQVIVRIKSFFAKHDIPDLVISNNGPQFTDHEFMHFAIKDEFRHVTTKPRYSQSNELVENCIKIIRAYLNKAGESDSGLYLALLHYSVMNQWHQ